MSDVFVSYSRRDSEFVHGMVRDLESRGKSVWLDTEGIGDGEVFPEAIRNAIEQSDGFVFVISPDSVASRYCENEVEHALALNKRLVPVLRKPVPDEALPEAIRVRNWIPCTPDIEAEPALERLAAALDTDLEHAHAHTRWLVKALDWDSHSRDRSFLLRGSELASADAWLAGVGDRAEPAPTALQRDYIYASRRASSRRQRQLVIASLIAVVAAVVLAGFALLSRSQAVSAQHVSESRRLASESVEQLPVDAERSILLGVQALNTAVTPEATYALRRALDESPLRIRLPSVGLQPYNGFWGPAIAYRPDGKRIAEGSENGYVTIFDAATGHIVRRISIGAQAPIVAYNPSGTLLAVGTGHDVRIIDPATGTTREIAKTEHITWGPFVFSADGSTAYFADEVSVDRWDLRTDRLRQLATGNIGAVGTVPNGITQTVLSHDGRRLFVADNPGVAIIDSQTGRPLATNTLADQNPWWIALSPDGRTLAVAVSPIWPSFSMSGSIELLDARTLKLERVLAHVSGVAFQTIAFSPNGRWLAFGGSDGSAGIFDVPTGEKLVTFPGHTTDIYQVAFSPDGRNVITAAGDGRAFVWRATGPEEASIPTDGFDTRFNGWQTADLRFQSGRVLARFVPRDGPNQGKEVIETYSVDGARVGTPFVIGPASDFTRLSLDGNVALAGLQEFNGTVLEKITIWNVANRKRVQEFTPTGYANFPTLSPDGRRLAYQASTPEDVAETRDLATGKTTRLGKYACGGGYTYFAISADDRLVAGNGICGLLHIWDATTGREISTADFVGDLNLGPLRFSPDGSLLAVANSGNLGQVTILDVASGRVLTTVTGGTAEIQDLAFSPNGSLLATASLDGTGRIWDAHTGKPLRQLDHPDPVNNVAFSPDGRRVATLDFAGVIRIWDACTDCRNPTALLETAKHRLTRQLTPEERRIFLGG